MEGRIKCSNTHVNVKFFSTRNTLSIYRHCPLSASARSKFYVREPPHDRPDWLKVGLTLGTSVFLWIYVSFYSLDVVRPRHRGEEKCQCEIVAKQISHPIGYLCNC